MSIVKIVILVLLGIVTYKLVKIMRNEANTKKKGIPSQDKVVDVMVQDPHCKTYFPKNQGVMVRIDNKDVHFCSATCKQAFIDQINSKK